MNSDYIVLLSKELNFLKEFLGRSFRRDNNLLDYGKVIIARDYKENINACINIIRNILGEEIASSIKSQFMGNS